MQPTDIEPWAHRLASEVAPTHGWRASEVYLMLVSAKREADEYTARRLLRIIDECALPGEAFMDAFGRVAKVCDEMEEEL